MDLRRSVFRYRPQPNRDGEIVKLLLELAHGRPEQGFGKLFKRLRRLGHGWNHKRVYRVYCGLKLNKRRKGKRRLPTRNPAPLQVTQTMNECWSADFMSDALWDGPRFRTFNVVNRSYREAVLDMFVFQSLDEVREQTETWLREYNEERPHDSLGDLTPREYLLTQNPDVSTYDWS